MQPNNHSNDVIMYPLIIWEDRRLSNPARLIYMLMCDCASIGEVAVFSPAEIQDTLQLSKYRYQKHIKILEDCGYIIPAPEQCDKKLSKVAYRLAETISIPEESRSKEE